ncbi:hypothetical protein OOU_Y34scaffold00926g2 [Pyricularia oryzae Y34]|uniref:Uncharacterized protein n=2 Tax=Pyricularia oryzae TaxID=318829 RepID=A0AA97PGB9_PYRO3|nr:hypothetical protein OOU_Y34scaffold00926g2 [Pyricularia oryzae Y34]
MSSTGQRIISSEYPLAPLEGPNASLDWTDQATEGPEPNTIKSIDEQGEQYVSCNHHLQPHAIENPFADPPPHDQYDAFEYCDEPMTHGSVAPQDFILRPYTQQEPTVKTIIIICQDHCKVRNGAGFGCGRPCAERFCPNAAFATNSGVCFDHAMAFAMYDARQRYSASREAVALERARDEREAAAAALSALNTGLVDRPMPDPEKYMKWYNEELDKYYCIKATERLLQAARATMPGQPEDPLRLSIQVTAQTFLETFTAPRQPVESGSESEE